MQYRDFVIDIGPEGFLKSHYQGKTEDGQLGLNDDLRTEVEKRYLDEGWEWTRDSVLSFGDNLRKALFNGKIATQIEDALGIVSAADKGLRVILRIDPSYSLYPWEAMSRNGTPMSIDSKTPIVRGLKGANRSISLEDQPLRILVIASNPVYPGLSNVDSRTEIKKIKEEIGKTIKLDIVGVEQEATRDKIDSVIKAEGVRYNIIHFIGHGDFDSKKNKGYLILEDENRRPDKTDETDIEKIFLNQGKLGLMVLNACDSAKVSGVGTGLVPKLIEKVPAVISMRSRISSDASVVFSKGFYLSLAGKNIEETIQEARQSMFTIDYQDKDPRDFSIPVLYLGLGTDDENPAVVSGELFYKKYKSQRPDVLGFSLAAEEDPAVTVLRNIYERAMGELLSLHMAVEDCVQLTSDKESLRMVAKTSRATSDTFKENIEKLSKEIEQKFPNTYKQTAITFEELESRIDDLKDCFGEIAAKIKTAEKTMGCIKVDIKELYMTTVRGILQESSKRQSGVADQ